MDSLTHKQRYLPHELSTRFYAVKLYRTGSPVSFVCRRYKISKSSLMRWNKAFDGTKLSLLDRSHRPHSTHPRAHTQEDLLWIKNYYKRNPNISICELYGKLRLNKGYSRHPGSLYRVFVRLGYRNRVSYKKKPYKPKPYDTPKCIGLKWQMDIKFIPGTCYHGKYYRRFFQYTVIDEASRERFIYPYEEQCGYSTDDFLKRAVRYFGYAPKILQTDNGLKFCNTVRTDKKHILDIRCEQPGIVHRRIRPRTPRHNGKVERSHRNDQERFYNFLSFYSLNDLKVQMKRYLYRSNRIPMAVLGWLSPIDKRRQLISSGNYVT